MKVKRKTALKKKIRNKTYYVALHSPTKVLGEVYVKGKYPSGVKNYIYEINTKIKEKKLGKHLVKKEQNEYSTYTPKQNRAYRKKYKESPAQYLIGLHKIQKKQVAGFKFLGTMR